MKSRKIRTLGVVENPYVNKVIKLDYGVWRNTDLTSKEKLILSSLNSGIDYPQLGTILGYSDNIRYRTITSLRKKGYVSKKGYDLPKSSSSNFHLIPIQLVAVEGFSLDIKSSFLYFTLFNKAIFDDSVKISDTIKRYLNLSDTVLRRCLLELEEKGLIDRPRRSFSTVYVRHYRDVLDEREPVLKEEPTNIIKFRRN